MFQKPQSIEAFEDIEKILRQWWQLFQELIPFKEILFASTTWNPASIATNAEAHVHVTVTGAALGDFVLVSFSLDIQDMQLTAAVHEANTVGVSLSNNTAGAIDLDEGTLYVMVLKAQKE